MNQSPIEIQSPLEKISSFSEEEGKDKWLFNQKVLRGFEALKKYISEVEHKDFFSLALVSSIMQCSNAKKDGKCLRYKKNWKELDYSVDTLRENFFSNAIDIIEDLEKEPLLIGKRDFFSGDSRTEMKKIEKVVRI